MAISPEEMEKKLDRLGWKQQEHDRRLDTTQRGLSDVTKAQQQDHERLEKYIAVSESAAKAAQEAADRSLTAKQLYISLGVFLLALAGLIAGFHT